jgi:Lrp/AsnC family leucine-responsive transcriptional regulator
MAFELDDQDRRILAILSEDARTAVSQIADQIKLSRPAVADRIEKLERNGVIRGATVVLDPAALGRNVTAFVSARQAGPFTPKAARVFRELMKSDEVLEIHTVAGDDCYLMKIRTDSIQSLNALVTRLTIPPLSLTTRTTIVMQSHCEKVGGIALDMQINKEDR